MGVDAFPSPCAQKFLLCLTERQMNAMKENLESHYPLYYLCSFVKFVSLLWHCKIDGETE